MDSVSHGSRVGFPFEKDYEIRSHLIPADRCLSRSVLNVSPGARINQELLGPQFNGVVRCCPQIAEISFRPVKSRFALQDLNHLGAAVQWHNNVISAARSRKRETASATPTTSPSGAGTSTCVRCTRK